ncbi:hypothetical protein D3C85_1909550 [compost metagenome]
MTSFGTTAMPLFVSLSKTFTTVCGWFVATTEATSSGFAINTPPVTVTILFTTSQLVGFVISQILYSIS